MDKKTTLDTLAALAHETRLDTFRYLIECGPEGQAAGLIAAHIGTPQNTMSTHLGILTRAGLINATRTGRSIRYTARLEGLHALVSYLTEDCCGGQPHKCAPVLDPLFETLARNFQEKAPLS